MSLSGLHCRRTSQKGQCKKCKKKNKELGHSNLIISFSGHFSKNRMREEVFIFYFLFFAELDEGFFYFLQVLLNPVLDAFKFGDFLFLSENRMR